MKLNKFESNVLQWATDRGIIENGNSNTQMLKLVSEMGELADNLAKGNDVSDDIGDCMVVLTIIARLQGLDLTTCTDKAWSDIKDRKGFLNKEGVFIKESDNNYKQLVMEFE